MMVTFISQCEKKALARTRRVLDAFANRIGDRTWQAIITEEGLIAVKKLLRQTVTKNSAIACHWMRSRVRNELLWIVGNRQKFNAQGVVPVNSTMKNHRHGEWENDWTYLPVIKAVVAVAALLHDWGKANVIFQQKLKHPKKGDPLRHEWLSCLLLNALVELSEQPTQDDSWLNMLIEGDFEEKKLMDVVENYSRSSEIRPLKNLPPLAQFIAWLILTHHRLPYLDNKDISRWHEQEMVSVQHMLQHITEHWGYANSQDPDSAKRRTACFQFQHGLLSSSNPWRKATQKWSSRLKEQQAQILILMNNGAWRLVLHHARLCLMLGDHYYSSLDAKKDWPDIINLYANTDKNKVVKQKLDEHLIGVSEQALKVSQSLARFATDMAMAKDIKLLKQKSPKGYEWQDIATDKIKLFKSKNEEILSKGIGWFVVNMASTGCGKTIANAKIMRALSDDGESLRYILALGLRTLTLQTGDEYRKKIGLDNEELAILIGSAAVQELHHGNKRKIEETDYENIGSESMEELLEEELQLDENMNFYEAPVADFLAAIIPQDKSKKLQKNQAFLYKPVLVCTIDHIIAATEKTKGGKYILPCLRLLSSDLVIDEVDDFDGKDLVAIGRLIHLAGMLGRKVMISSATIPPAVAEGFFNAYQMGWHIHAGFKNTTSYVTGIWVDEFFTKISMINQVDIPAIRQQYKENHQEFIGGRINKLQQQIIKRKAHIILCSDIYYATELNFSSYEEYYYEKMKQAAIDLHQNHFLLDKETGKRVSFGVIRMANIPPCIQLSKYLINSHWPENIAPKILTYHSRQVLLLRSQQEKHLDEVLKRNQKEDDIPYPLKNPIIRNHLNNTVDENVLFILVATPVEEVGRDHDFDWAVIEPSSYRSIIQLGGRVRRHRHSGIDEPNIAIMQYNLKALRKDGKPAYCRPGYEVRSYQLASHDLCQLLDESVLNQAVNAIPRISLPKTLEPQARLIDLEHKVLADYLTNYEARGPECLQAWFSEYWWLTAMPQQCNKFRDSQSEITLHLVWKEGRVDFQERNQEGALVAGRGELYGIRQEDTQGLNQANLWLNRDYDIALRRHGQNEAKEQSTHEIERQMNKDSQRYGEIMIPDRQNKNFTYSDQFGLLEESL